MKEIVKFVDGTYGIRKGNWFFGYKYRDLKAFTHMFWWSDESQHFNDCKGSLEEVKTYISRTDNRISEVIPIEDIWKKEH